jgi:hypothetical protein
MSRVPLSKAIGDIGEDAAIDPRDRPGILAVIKYLDDLQYPGKIRAGFDPQSDLGVCREKKE